MNRRARRGRERAAPLRSSKRTVAVTATGRLAGKTRLTLPERWVPPPRPTRGACGRTAGGRAARRGVCAVAAARRANGWLLSRGERGGGELESSNGRGREPDLAARPLCDSQLQHTIPTTHHAKDAKFDTSKQKLAKRTMEPLLIVVAHCQLPFREGITGQASRC